VEWTFEEWTFEDNMEWTFEDNMVDDLFFCPTLTGGRAFFKGA